MADCAPDQARYRRVFYYPLSSVIVLLLPELLRFGVPFWRSDRLAEAPLLCLGYVASVGLSTLAGPRPLRRLAAGLSGLAGVGAIAGAISVMAPAVLLSRSVVAIALAVATLLLAGAQLRNVKWRSGLLLVLAAAGVAATTRQSATEADRPPTNAVVTAYYALEVTDHGQLAHVDDLHPGGGLARVDDRAIAMTGKGVLYRLARRPDGSIASTRLTLTPPVDLASFAPEMVAGSHAESVRATDVIARSVEAGWQVFVSHHAWTAATQCVNLVVSTATLSHDLTTVVADWSVLTVMQPCQPAERVEPGGGFQGQMGGGRMAWRDGSLLITVGDHGFDGVGRPLTVAQLDDQDYGKTRLIDITTGTVRPFTKGNRNPQGLYIDPAGRIWSTEHGPRGGDELNLLTEGGNYGWPFATYGTAYELLSWPPADTAAPDPSFIPPRFAWVPSVGISNLVGVNADRFPRWKGNLLVGSLAAQSLYRVAVEGTEVRYVERIPIGVKIRDIVEFPDGDLWIWTDTGHALTVRPASAELRAATAFQVCSGCHRSAAGVAGGIGPNLAGIVGRGVAAQASYPGYSAALRQIGGTWTEQRLDAFLADPVAFAPGTTMTYRVSSPEDRAAIIAYLRTPR